MTEDLVLPQSFAGIMDVMSGCLAFKGDERISFQTIHDKLLIVSDKIQNLDEWPELKIPETVVENFPYEDV